MDQQQKIPPEQQENTVKKADKPANQKAMICGIAAFACYFAAVYLGFCCSGAVLEIAAVVLGIVAIVLALKHKRQTNELGGYGIAALITGIYAIVQSVYTAVMGFFGGLIGLFYILLSLLYESGILVDILLDFAPFLL